MVEQADAREHAIRRVKAKREFTTHLAIYLVVNVALVGIWAASGAGYFWPIWAIGGWGIGLFFHWWNAYREARPITEDDIQREMRKAGR
jgi:hypothetical protein